MADTAITDKFETMQEKLKGQFNTVFALTAASQPLILATLFGVNMVFRFLKFGKRVRKVYEAQQKQFDESVRMQGVVLMPVNIRPTTTLVTNFFTTGLAELVFPNEFNSMKEYVNTFQTGNFAERREAIRKLEVAYFLMNEGKDWRDNETLMTLANKAIKAEEEITFAKMVETLEPIFGKELIGFDDFDHLLEEYAAQELQSLNLDINQLRGNNIQELRSTVKEMFWDTMLFGEDNTVNTTLVFIGQEKLRAQRKRLETIDQAIQETENEETKKALNKEKKAIEDQIAALTQFDTPMENSGS